MRSMLLLAVLIVSVSQLVTFPNLLFAQQYGSGVSGSTAFSAEPAEGYYATRPYKDAFKQAYVADYQPKGEYRQPTSIVFVDPSTALITTKVTGQVFQLTLPAREVVEVLRRPEASFGKVTKLTEDLVAICEQRRNEIVLLRRKSNHWESVGSLDAPGFPEDLEWDAANASLVASSRWAQRLYRWRLSEPNCLLGNGDLVWKSREEVDLPMCGGEVLLLPKHDCILVVDAFGRHYAVVAEDSFAVWHSGELYGHNVTDLASTEDEEMVYFPHQLLNEYARSVRTDITWGGLLSNNIRWLRTERLLHETGEQIFKKGKFYPLGTPGNGAGDPSSMSVSTSGRLAITLGGTNRVAIGAEKDYYFRQVDVGYRPVDCEYSPDGKELFVVNQFSDSISIVTLDGYQVEHLPLGALREPTEVELGEQAFFNSRLSHDSWMSCHSCHSDGHTNGQLNDNFTDNSFGTPKRVLSLLGQAETMPYAWGGNIENLETQVNHSLVSTMASKDEPNVDLIKAIATYVRSLPQPPSVMEARASANQTVAFQDQPLVRQGHELFVSLNCNDCHAGSRFTSLEVFDIGLKDEGAMTRFNPPSLVSLSQRQNSLFHDGRAKSIYQVIGQVKHQLPRAITASEEQALVRYLESL